jgi:hypothetical protein
MNAAVAIHLSLASPGWMVLWWEGWIVHFICGLAPFFFL